MEKRIFFDTSSLIVLSTIIAEVFSRLLKLGMQINILDEVVFELMKLKAKEEEKFKNQDNAVKVLDVLEFYEKIDKPLTVTSMVKLRKKWSKNGMHCVYFVDNIFKEMFLQNNIEGIFVTDDKKMARKIIEKRWRNTCEGILQTKLEIYNSEEFLDYYLNGLKEEFTVKVSAPTKFSVMISSGVKKFVTFTDDVYITKKRKKMEEFVVYSSFA